MKKYSFLVYHREYEKFLLDIQELGVVHVIEKDSGKIEDEELQKQYSLIKQFASAIKFLEKREKEPINEAIEKDGIEILEDIQKLQHDCELYQQQLFSLLKELSTIEPWGEFSWESIERLENAELKTRFFTSPLKKFTEYNWPKELFVEKINEINGLVYFVVFDKKGEKSEIDAEEIALPKKSYSQIGKQIKDIEGILDKAEVVFDNHAEKHLSLLRKSKDELIAKLSFNKVILNTTAEADNKLMILEGWSPVDKIKELDSFLEANSVYFTTEQATPKDQVPIKLKNNRFAKLYEVIGELYTFPNYGEIDLTPFFAPFYMLFFGFCLGDAGYGLIITIATIIGLIKAKPKLKPLFRLGVYLGIATTIMGVISGTLFGILLLDVKWAWIQQYQAYMLDNDKMMYLAIGLGYFQVLFGMFIKAANLARMYGFKYCISQLGWNLIVMFTIPSFALANYNIIDNTALGYNIALITLIVGAIPALFYNTPGKNPLINLGTGLWDTYQTASGLLGDVLSYIRLFALGISSAILGNVFNTLAMDLSPDTIILRQIVMVLILAFGHSLNFFMAILGSFVHPLRLTFVEFYKNSGFIGGGKKYEPFRK